MKKQYKKITAKIKRIPLFFSCLLPLISCFLLLAACAKKMLPPSPDRFAPRLLVIEPINRIKIDLTFDEDINISKMTNQSLVITTTNKETLRIRTISSRKNTISLFTEPTKPGLYYISGMVEDKNKNLAQVNKKFLASSTIDTIAPRVAGIFPSPGTTKKIKNVYIEFSFSEPMDTTSAVRFLTLSLDTSQIKWSWSSDWQKLTFGYPESLLPNTTVYFALQPTIHDLENNRIKEYGYTFFTSDSNLAPILVTGNLFYENQPYKSGIVIFSNPASKSLALSDISGKFSVRLDTAIFNVTAISDTDFDNQIDLLAELKDFNPADTNKIKLDLKPISEKKDIDQYLR